MDLLEPDVVDVGALRAVVRMLTRVHGRDDADRIDQLRALEEITCAAAGAQARLTVEFAESQRLAQEEAGVPAHRVGRGVAAQVALARRESPFQGGRHLGLAHALVELPHTAGALSSGQVSEWRATVVARETACLSREDRARVDAELADRRGGLAALGDRGTEAEARRIAYRLDPHSFTRRAAKAEGDRRVTVRPAPDTMTHLSALLPVRQGVAVFAALTRHADGLRSGGDPRPRGQIMADTLVERVTGRETTDTIPLEVQVVMTAESLVGGVDTPAEVIGMGPVPAPLVRQWLADPEGEAFVRRLWAAPATHELVALESTRRRFDGGLRRFVTLRDQVCRTPWCDAPIRHVDHSQRHADGGATSAANGQGLCEACNQAKEAPGWRTASSDDAVETVTPTGHRHRSRPPPMVGRPITSAWTPVEISFRDAVLRAA